MRPLKFALLTIAILVTRGLDILTTYRVTPSLSEEANPLTSVFGFGWPALLASNVLISALVIAGAWRAILRDPPVLPGKTGLNFDEFVSLWWFGNQRRPWWHAFFRRPRDAGLVWYALGRVAPPIVIAMGVIVAVHNSYHYANRSALELMVALIYTAGIFGSVVGLYLFFRTEFARYLRATLAPATTL